MQSVCSDFPTRQGGASLLAQNQQVREAKPVGDSGAQHSSMHNDHCSCQIAYQWLLIL